MATDFGFLPVTKGKHYFISYNTEDTHRVKSIAQALHKAGVPMWYDYGLEYGAEWEEQIALNIHTAQTVLMFITSGIFDKKRSYVRKEYGIADSYGIRIIPVILDSINPRTIPDRYAGWWQDIKLLHCVVANNKDDAQTIAKKIMLALGIPEKQEPLPVSSDDYAKTIEPVSPIDYGKTIAEPKSLVKKDATDFVPDKEEPKDRGETRKKIKTIALVVSAVVVVSIVAAIVAIVWYGLNSKEDVPDKIGHNTPSQTYSVDVLDKIGHFTPSQTYSVGDHVLFGNYEQDGDESNGAEEIEWRILNIEDGKALMISEYLLDAKRFDDSSNDWSNSELREWLNNDFYNTAFSSSEHKQMTAYNGDKVTLLSEDEVELFLDDYDDRMAKPTAYAVRNGAFVDSEFDTGWWWLRSSGLDSSAVYVDTNGNINTYGLGVLSDILCVRPVVQVQLSN